MSNNESTPWERAAKELQRVGRTWTFQAADIIERACREHAEAVNLPIVQARDEAQAENDRLRLLEAHHNLCRAEVSAPDDDVLLERIKELQAENGALRRMSRGFCEAHDADCETCPCCEAVNAVVQLAERDATIARLREALAPLIEKAHEVTRLNWDRSVRARAKLADAVLVAREALAATPTATNTNAKLREAIEAARPLVKAYAVYSKFNYSPAYRESERVLAQIDEVLK